LGDGAHDLQHEHAAWSRGVDGVTLGAEMPSDVAHPSDDHEQMGEGTGEANGDEGIAVAQAGQFWPCPAGAEGLCLEDLGTPCAAQFAHVQFKVLGLSGHLGIADQQHQAPRAARILMQII
jgi:hypothetical protein